LGLLLAPFSPVAVAVVAIDAVAALLLPATAAAALLLRSLHLPASAAMRMLLLLRAAALLLAAAAVMLMLSAAVTATAAVAAALLLLALRPLLPASAAAALLLPAAVAATVAAELLLPAPATCATSAVGPTAFAGLPHSPGAAPSSDGPPVAPFKTPGILASVAAVARDFCTTRCSGSPSSISGRGALLRFCHARYPTW